MQLELNKRGVALLEKFLAMLDELDDVQRGYHNIELVQAGRIINRLDNIKYAIRSKKISR